MKVLIVTLGSHGDVHPFCGLGVALRARGHEVTVLASDHFRPLIERADLIAGPSISSDEDFRELIADPDLWHPRRGAKFILAAVEHMLARVYDAVVGYVGQNPGCVVVASSLGLAARCAQDKLGFPMATVHLAPMVLRSIYAIPKISGLKIPNWTPLWLRRWTFAALDRFLIDPMVAPGLNAFRAERGLPPVKRVLNVWWNSPDRVIGLWPDWYAPLQPDWPPQTVLTDFPLWDERGLQPLDDTLRQFLAAGSAPIAFTPGSAMVHGQDFFAAAAEACRRLGRRGLLLSRHAGQMPATLPQGVIHAPYAPFSELLPQCAALVHHGGIGCTSQALRAGTPQLVMPMAHDQFDNAERVVKLGVAATIKRRAFTGPKVARALQNLLGDPALAARCAAVAKRFEGHDALAETAAVIEQLRPDTARQP